MASHIPALSSHRRSVIANRHAAASSHVTANRERLAALDAPIGRIAWQLVGLAADGSLPEA